MITKEEVFEGLKEILTVIRPSTDLTGVNYDTELVRELGVDSLTMMLLSLAVEEKYNMRFPALQEPFRTVGEVCDFVVKTVGQAA